MEQQHLAELPREPEVNSILTVIAHAARDPNVDVDKMERLLQMQERVLARQAETAYNRDFAKMQNEMPVVTERGEIKDRDGKGRGKYALFEDINEAVKPIMQKHGFAISFKVATDAAHTTVTGVLMHREGHREETTMTLPADQSGSKNTVQSLGSSISYGQRYVLRALLNISSRGEDTDAVVYISEDQVLTLDTLMQDAKADRALFLKFLGVNSLAELPATKFKDAIQALEIKKGKKKTSHDSAVKP